MASQVDYSYIISDDKILMCGYNGFGQLGLGDRVDRNTFVEMPEKNMFKQMSRGIATVFGVKKDGTVWATGYNGFGQFGVESPGSEEFIEIPIEDTRKVTITGHSTFVLKKDDTLWVSGHNGNGQLGLGDNIQRNVFTKVNISDVNSVVSDVFHTFVLKNDGTVWATGYNRYGQLGLGDNIDRSVFAKVNISDVKDIVCGDNYTIILKKDGTLWACGNNTHGQLGLSDNTQRNVFTKVNINDVKQISCGGIHTVALKNDGTVWGCGTNQYGQLGLGHNHTVTTLTKVNVTDVKQISCGRDFSFILKNDGTLWSCGHNKYGQLGLGDNVDRMLFARVNVDNVSCIIEEQQKMEIISNLLYCENKYFKLNEDRLLEEISIHTEDDFIEHGMDKMIDLISQDINGNTPIDLLPDEFEIRTYRNISDSIELDVTEPSFKPIDDLEDTFEILTYSDEESDNQLNVKALPVESQLIIPTGDIELYSIDNIHQLKILENGTNGYTKVIISCDSGVTWKTFKDGVWSDISLDKTNIETNGMSTNELSSISKEKWNEILKNGKIRVTYLLSKDSVESTYEVDKLEILVDMKGTWDDTLKNIDYDIEYMNGYLLRVTLKTGGDYKINYAGKKSSY